LEFLQHLKGFSSHVFRKRLIAPDALKIFDKLLGFILFVIDYLLELFILISDLFAYFVLQGFLTSDVSLQLLFSLE
jgi:hypothetical protein